MRFAFDGTYFMNPSIFLRALLPSWRFFDRAITRADLRVKCDDALDWEPVFARPIVRRLSHLFFNPEQNYRFAAYSLLEQFLDEGPRSVSHELIEAWIGYEYPHAKTVSYQIVRFDSDKNELVVEYESPRLTR